VAALLTPTVDNKIKKISIGCLAAVMFVQTIAYTVLWNIHFFMRNFAVGGALILL